MTGYSAATWNGPGGTAPLNAYSRYHDIFILKLNNSGAYQWHTFYGSAGDEYGYSLAVDSGGNVYVTGYSGPWNGPGGTTPLNAYSGYYGNASFILKLSSAGAYQWHTFYGSGSGDSIAVDSGGNLYITGSSDGGWNGPGGTTPLNAYNGSQFGSSDIFVLKLSQDSLPQTCTYTIAPTSQTFTSTGGTGNVTVTASADTCAWTSSSSSSWVTITTGSSGTGNGTVSYSVAANTGTVARIGEITIKEGMKGILDFFGTGTDARIGEITIAGQTFTIIQSAASCTYTITPTSKTFTSKGGSGTVAVKASPSTCTWTATESLSWVSIKSGSKGTGNGTVKFSVSANNSGATRTGNMTIAGKTFVITQTK